MYAVKNIRLLVPANKAKPSPAIGQALGSVGINMAKFCKEFNAVTTQYVDDIPMRVRLAVMNDGSYKFTTHLPQSSWFIKKALKLETLGQTPSKSFIGTIHVKQLYELAILKQNDNEELKRTPLKSVFKSLLASMHSYGVEVSYETEPERAKRIAAFKSKEVVVDDKKKKKKISTDRHGY